VWDGYPLRSARLVLRPARAEESEALAPRLDPPESGGLPLPGQHGDATAFSAAEQARRERRGVALLLERVSDGALIGGIGFALRAEGIPELAFWVARPAWGQGYATEAARRLVRHLMQDLGFERVAAWAPDDHPAAWRVLSRVGLIDAGAAPSPLPASGRTMMGRRFTLGRAAWAEAHAARPHLLVAAAALVDGDGRVLMTTRPPGKSMAGLWEFPGGKVAPGETPEQALVRELEEELGLDVTASCLAPLAFASHDYDTFHLLMPLYVLRVWQGSPQPREGQTLRWVRGARLGDLPMPPADIPLVALLREWV